MSGLFKPSLYLKGRPKKKTQREESAGPAKREGGVKWEVIWKQWCLPGQPCDHPDSGPIWSPYPKASLPVLTAIPSGRESQGNSFSCLLS